MVCITVIIVNQALPYDTEPQDLDGRRQNIMTKPSIVEGHQTPCIGDSTFPRRCCKKPPIKATVLYHEMLKEMLGFTMLEYVRIPRVAPS